MAGIGFQLKKLIDSDDSYFHKIRTYVYSLFVIYGPLLMCIFSISYIQGVMRFFNVDRESAQLFSTVTGYIFSASNMTTGVIALVLTRYVSDLIYLENYKKVVPSFYGGVLLTIIPAMAIFFCVQFYLKSNLIFSILTGIFFGLINIAWILLIYLGALSNHKKILKIFITGVTITIISLLFCKFMTKAYLLYYIILCLNLGFTVIGSLLFFEIKEYFGEGEGSIWEFMTYFRKFPSLVFINIFYIGGLYFEGFYCQFFAGFRNIRYLEVIYIASFVLIPGMIYFIIRFETSYFEKHNILFNTINQRGTYEDIGLAKENLVNLVKFELKMLFRSVCIFTFIIMFLGMHYFLSKGTNVTTIVSFVFISFGMCLTVMMYVVKVLFLYFDLRGYALCITTCFIVFNIGLTILENMWKVEYVGFGILGASGISFCVGLIALKIFFNKLDYYLFKVS